jgi:protein SCO1
MTHRSNRRFLSGVRCATGYPAGCPASTVPGRRGLAALRLAALAGAALLLLLAGRGMAHDMAEGAGENDHMASAPTRTMRKYAVPPVHLVRDDGKQVSLPEEMDDGRPVVLNFIFTTCSDICPMMSAVFSQFEHRLGAEAGGVHLMSISIDPEQDTPARLLEYARRFHAGPEWRHYTGTLAASIAAQRAFDVYRGGKMSHAAVTLLRAAPGKPWLRIDGFVKPDELVHEYQELLAAR